MAAKPCSCERVNVVGCSNFHYIWSRRQRVDIPTAAYCLGSQADAQQADCVVNAAVGRRLSLGKQILASLTLVGQLKRTSAGALLFIGGVNPKTPGDGGIEIGHIDRVLCS